MVMCACVMHWERTSHITIWSAPEEWHEGACGRGRGVARQAKPELGAALRAPRAEWTKGSRAGRSRARAVARQHFRRNLTARFGSSADWAIGCNAVFLHPVFSWQDVSSVSSLFPTDRKREGLPPGCPRYRGAGADDSP